ncbi:MAG: cytochrome c [Alphaproteobacteria bacterium]|nr:cytochrome c [Alphaproteobacteria bacterium]
MKNRKIALVFAAGIGVTTLAVNTVWAHGGATGIVKERMESMKTMGTAMKGMAAMVKGEAPMDDIKIANFAATLKTGATHIPRMFPKGSNEGPSEALPNIWQEWDRFEEIAQQLQKDADMLASASSKDPRSVKIGFAKVGKACKDCHTDFRKKKAE